jgi:hypothetical protein
MRRKILFPLLFSVSTLILSISITHAEDQPKAERKAKKSKVQIAILLDTSGSMEGLIHQARTQLWKIVNDFENCRKNKRRPDLEVALYEYGKSSLPVTEHYLKQIVPFTGDLDILSEKLFELRTNGGQEYCGAVIHDAVLNLEWSKRPDDLKMIFIAGNEPFSQGPIDFRSSCRSAISNGVTINTIHCGSEAEGKRGFWAEGALLGEGEFLNINHNDVRPVPSTPYDKRLMELSSQLNTTYVPYGQKDKQESFLKRQEAQDANASEAAPSVAAGRAATKSSGFYRNSTFDLLDAIEEGKVKLKSLKEDELPPELKKLSPEKRDEYLAQKKKERLTVQSEIKKLNKQRTQHLAELTEATPDGETQFDDAVLKTVRTQAKARNFEYATPE